MRYTNPRLYFFYFASNKPWGYKARFEHEKKMKQLEMKMCNNELQEDKEKLSLEQENGFRTA